MYGCDICPGMKWSSFDEMLGHMHSVHGAYLDAKTSAAKYADLLQSHSSLCGKIEELKDELRKANLQNIELVEMLRKIHSLATVHDLDPQLAVKIRAISTGTAKYIEKPSGVDAHGNMESGLRCSTSSCDELAVCKRCFGCKDHCTEKREGRP